MPAPSRTLIFSVSRLPPPSFTVLNHCRARFLQRLPVLPKRFTAGTKRFVARAVETLPKLRVHVRLVLDLVYFNHSVRRRVKFFTCTRPRFAWGSISIVASAFSTTVFQDVDAIIPFFGRPAFSITMLNIAVTASTYVSWFWLSSYRHLMAP